SFLATRLFFLEYIAGSLLYCSAAHRARPSFPTRRSSDLSATSTGGPAGRSRTPPGVAARQPRGPCVTTTSRVRPPTRARATSAPDRKSTRLNSSHVKISYAVFCLKKKNREQHQEHNVYIQ